MEETLKDSFLHPHRDKAGRRPRAAGAKTEEKIPRGEPSCGISDRGKSIEHGHNYACYPEGIAPKNKDRRG